MAASIARPGKDKKMAIIASYLEGESYGLLGPQIAATVIEENTPYQCIVIAVDRNNDKSLLKKDLAEYFGVERPIVGFSTLSGREDLFLLAKELKDEGAVTILAGPQADVDYVGEEGWQTYSHRFSGLANYFSFALQGPAEQIVPFLLGFPGDGWKNGPGVFYHGESGQPVKNPKKAWDEKFLCYVKWENIFRPGQRGLVPIAITTGQVLQHIGCPQASHEQWSEMPYPTLLADQNKGAIRLLLKGCSFCDVAVDKGFHGSLRLESILMQIQRLPDGADGRKIPFELINENPLPGLPHLLQKVRDKGVSLSQINLTMRADWLVLSEKSLREALHMAGQMGFRILLASVGFESFDNRILKNLNKGLNVETNLLAIQLMRRLKEEFPIQWAYSIREGAVHGFIHPTPWDTEESARNLDDVIDHYSLSADILDHSIPLIIHHASALGTWAREIERIEKVRFKRYVSVIGWWEDALESLPASDFIRP